MDMQEFEERRRTRREAAKKKKRKRLIILIVILVVAVAAIIAVPIMTRVVALRPGETVSVTIEEGQDTKAIANVLKQNGIIANKLMFLMSVNRSEYKGKLQYGTFEFNGDMSLDEILKTLATEGAKKDTVTITFPEGYSVEMIVAKCVESGIGTQEEFTTALSEDYNYAFIAEIPKAAKRKHKLQGFLFPSTYEFFKTATAHEVIDTMLAEFDKQYKTLKPDYSGVYETIIKASLIEREAKLSEENAKIAGVIENRLKKNMKLQIDATVVYAISDGMYNVDRVLYKDLEIDSPYNTYQNEGLPIGSICNPGLEAIKAALNPETHNYLYYRTDDTKADGSHIFTETFSEHTTVGEKSSPVPSEQP